MPKPNPDSHQNARSAGDRPPKASPAGAFQPGPLGPHALPPQSLSPEPDAPAVGADDDASHPDSVVWWVQRLCSGDERAASEIWDRFFQRLAAEAKSQLSNRQLRVSDQDDLASGVLAALCDAAVNGRLPKLDSSEDIWRMLLAWMRNDVIDHVRHNNRQKRGDGKVRGDSIFAGQSGSAGFDQFMTDVPTPQTVVELKLAWCEFVETLRDDKLRHIATSLVRGKTRKEIAEQLGVTSRTVDRKVDLMYQLWHERTGNRSGSDGR
ncbi:MAG: ECF-type sigma factor [Planctomycetota bacterium]